MEMVGKSEHAMQMGEVCFAFTDLRRQIHSGKSAGLFTVSIRVRITECRSERADHSAVSVCKTGRR